MKRFNLGKFEIVYCRSWCSLKFYLQTIGPKNKNYRRQESPLSITTWVSNSNQFICFLIFSHRLTFNFPTKSPDTVWGDHEKLKGIRIKVKPPFPPHYDVFGVTGCVYRKPENLIEYKDGKVVGYLKK